MYQLFNREPDQTGLGYWIEQLDQGVSLQQIAQGFIDSSEFINLHNSLSDNQYIDVLYQNILDRSVDQDGMTYWTNDLAAGASRADILVSISESTENLTNVNDQIQNGFEYQLWMA